MLSETDQRQMQSVVSVPGSSLVPGSPPRLVLGKQGSQAERAHMLEASHLEKYTLDSTTVKCSHNIFYRISQKHPIARPLERSSCGIYLWIQILIYILPVTTAMYAMSCYTVTPSYNGTWLYILDEFRSLNSLTSGDFLGADLFGKQHMIYFQEYPV